MLVGHVVTRVRTTTRKKKDDQKLHHTNIKFSKSLCEQLKDLCHFGKKKKVLNANLKNRDDAVKVLKRKQAMKILQGVLLNCKIPQVLLFCPTLAGMKTYLLQQKSRM